MIETIELRSDTFTRPTFAMRQAMAEAECGDDMFGEDPTVNRLEARTAAMLGMEAAVFACSGTQSNQMAVWSHCRPGDELIIEDTGHIANYEAGGPAVLSGVSIRRIPGESGRIDISQLETVRRAPNLHFSPTTLVCIENSTNIGGGVTYSLNQIQRIADWAHSHAMKLHVDGARLFNACVARGYSPADVARHVDTVSICFSKGLGCPMGSILVGTDEVIGKARRARKIFGGALRQAGIVAAAALYALDHHLDRLADDHANAKAFAAEISRCPGVRCDPETVETNLVFFEIDRAWGTAAQMAAALNTRGVRMNALGPQRLRACTHLDVTERQALTAADVLKDLLAKPFDASQFTDRVVQYG